jgi:DNA-binding transcriptional regulator LsrR (DeoR family)
MSSSDILKASAMQLDPNITKTEVAAHLDLSRTTLNAFLKRLETEATSA